MASPKPFGITSRNDERVMMLELLWEVAYADGVLHDYEASLLRQVTGLLYVTDQGKRGPRANALSNAWGKTSVRCGQVGWRVVP